MKLCYNYTMHSLKCFSLVKYKTSYKHGQNGSDLCCDPQVANVLIMVLKYTIKVVTLKVTTKIRQYASLPGSKDGLFH